MLKYIALTLAVISVYCSTEARKHKVEDPFKELDQHITHSLAYHYLWPWSQLFKAAAALDAEESLEEPQIETDDKVYTIQFRARNFKPSELKVKVKNRYIIIEGEHKYGSDGYQFMGNHFVQRFAMPAGSKQEEVTAVYKNGVLIISLPKHELPPPLPEREVPIEVIVAEDKDKPEVSSEKIETSSQKNVEGSTEKNEVTSENTIGASSEKDIAVSSSATPLTGLDLTEATTHVGKIRKKELKTKTVKDNEVTKGDNNGLDYALVGSEFSDV